MVPRLRSTGVLALAAFAALAACARPSTPLGAAPAAPVDSAAAAADARIGADVTWLASPARGGRLAGSREADDVAWFLVRRYQALGLAGAFAASCAGLDCVPAYSQPFSIPGGGRGQNVAARVPGRDSALAGEVVIVGAHRDHIGRNAYMSMDPDASDPDRRPPLHPGADDNASGTAAVLELARRLAAHPARRTVLVVHFDAEEEGLYGSGAFTDHSPVPRAAVKLMVNLDMVGRLRADRLYIEVARGGRPVEQLADSATRAAALRPMSTAEIEGRSDHASFAEWKVPALALFTGFHSDYHRGSDIAARVNVPGIRRVVDVAESIVRAAADRPN
jgi:hypothetical protein